MVDSEVVPVEVERDVGLVVLVLVPEVGEDEPLKSHRTPVVVVSLPKVSTVVVGHWAAVVLSSRRLVSSIM